MKVEALNKDWEIKDISYGERRRLYQLNVKAFWKGEVEPDTYYEVLGEAFELSGLKESEVKDLPMPEVDQLLQAVLSAYLGLEKNADGD